MKGEKGLELAKKLLGALKVESKRNEKKRVYEERILKNALEVLGVRE